MKVYNHVRKISLQPVNTGHRAFHILIRFIDGRCERISDDMRDRFGEPLLREGRSVRSVFFAGCLQVLPQDFFEFRRADIDC